LWIWYKFRIFIKKYYLHTCIYDKLRFIESVRKGFG
jgi:hypothetical protein